MAGVVTTVDVPDCPMCSTPAKRLGLNDRGCLGCGFTWSVLTADDELDAEADREVRSREFNESKGRGRKVPKGAGRW